MWSLSFSKKKGGFYWPLDYGTVMCDVEMKDNNLGNLSNDWSQQVGEIRRTGSRTPLREGIELGRKELAWWRMPEKTLFICGSIERSYLHVKSYLLECSF